MNRAISRFAIYGLGLAILSDLAMMMAGLGSRWNWWDFRTGFSILTWGGYSAIAAALLLIIGAVRARPAGPRRGLTLAVLGLLIALIPVAVLWHWKQTAQRVPPIHDITTDTENPPLFVAIRPLRAGAPNPAEYGGSEIAAQQRAGYPELGPAILPVSPDQAFKRAEAVAREMCWEIVEMNPAEGRIEATATTFWFGFKDDVIIRIRAADSGSRIDARSVSRVGRSDVGTNARRIQKFLQKITHRG